MARHSAARAEATQGNDFAAPFQSSSDLETAGNSRAVAFLIAAIDGSGMPRKVLAEDHLHISEGELSKLLSSGRFRMDLIDKLPAAIRSDFAARMTDDHADPLDSAAEQLTQAALRFLRLRAARGKARMAKAGL